MFHDISYGWNPSEQEISLVSEELARTLLATKIHLEKYELADVVSAIKLEIEREALRKESFVEPDLGKNEFNKYVERTVDRAMKEPDVIKERQEKAKTLERKMSFGREF